MVNTQSKKQNIFSFWNDEIDFISNGSVLYWLPIYVDLLKVLNKQVKDGKAKRLKELAFIDYGYMPLEDYTTTNLGKALIRVTNIKGDGLIEMKDIKYVPNSDRTLEKLVKEGDSLIVQCGNTTGKIGFITKKLEGLVFPSFCLLVRTKKINPYFLNVILNSSVVQLQLKRGMGYSSVRPNITKPDVENLIIPILSNSEQKTIAEVFKEALRLKEESEKKLQEVKDFIENLIMKP